MKSYYILILIILMTGCKQNQNDKSDAIQTKENETLLQTKPVFNCSDHKESLKQANPEIQAVQNVREIDDIEKQAVDYYKKLYGNQKSSYVLNQKVPGVIQGICMAEVFFSSGSDKELLFTVSSLDGQDFVSYQGTNDLIATKSVVWAIEEQKKQKRIQEAESLNTSQSSSQEMIEMHDEFEEESPLSSQNVAEASSNSIEKENVKPSFNCDKASTNVEKSICNDSNLAKLDIKIAMAYEKAIRTNRINSESIKNSQKSWLKVRDNCLDVECISKSYETRYQELAQE